MSQQVEKRVKLDEQKFAFLCGDSLSQKRRRFMAFVEQTPPAKLFRKTALPPFVGMTIGGAVGGLVGLVGGPKFAAMGMGSGVGMGFLAGSSYAGYHTRKEYKKWLAQYRSDEILSEFAEIFKSYSVLNEFICPLTSELMIYPFVDPWGHSYEKKAIEKWIREHGISPLAHAPLQVANLRPNYGMMGKQAKTYRYILLKEMKSMALSELQRKGLEALLKDLEGQISTCFKAENGTLYELLKKGSIDEKAYVSELGLIADALFR